MLIFYASGKCARNSKGDLYTGSVFSLTRMLFILGVEVLYEQTKKTVAVIMDLEKKTPR